MSNTDNNTDDRTARLAEQLNALGRLRRANPRANGDAQHDATWALEGFRLQLLEEQLNDELAEALSL